MATSETWLNRQNRPKIREKHSFQRQIVKRSSKMKIPHILSMFVLILDKIVNKLIFSVKSKQPPTVLLWRVKIWRINFENKQIWRFAQISSNFRRDNEDSYNGVIWGRQKSVLCQLGLIGCQNLVFLATKIGFNDSADFIRGKSTANPNFRAKMWLRKIPEISTKRSPSCCTNKWYLYKNPQNRQNYQKTPNFAICFFSKNSNFEKHFFQLFRTFWFKMKIFELLIIEN